MDLLHTAHVPAGEGPFPTILALHGWGASAHDLLGLAPSMLDGSALVLCPQGPVALEIGPGQLGYGWFPITGGASADPAEFAKGAGLLKSWLDQALLQLPADPRKLAVVGFSQGGVMAFDLVLRSPERFVGLAALSSWLPAELAEDVSGGDALGRLPVLVQHGTRDPMIPIERARDTRTRLQQLGVALTYREYEMQHEICPDSLRHLIGWLEDEVLEPIKLA